MKKENILVSIILPVYNVEKYFEKCINSIMRQTHKNIEIILIDDGSKDSSGVMADNFAQKDKRIKVIHKQNEGVSSARNTGIDISTGEYICFADADDYVAEDYVEYLLNLAYDNNADMAIVPTHFTTFHQEQVPKEVMNKIDIYTPQEAIEKLLYYQIPIGVYCKIFKRSFLGNNLRFIPEIFIGEGFNFGACTLQRANKIAVGYKRIYFYRRDNSDSAMTRFNIDKVICGVKALQQIKHDLIIKTPQILRAWEYANWHTTSDMWIFIKLGNASKKYPILAKEYLKITRRKAYTAFYAPVPMQEKIRALSLILFPSIWPWLIRKRKKKHNII